MPFAMCHNADARRLEAAQILRVACPKSSEWLHSAEHRLWAGYNVETLRG